jgi:hypothetical protein
MITIQPLAILTSVANAANATLKIYTASDVLLGTIALASPIGTLTEDATHHILTFSASTPDQFADADGTASWGKITDENGLVHCIFDITTTGGGGGFTMPSTTVYMGGSISIMSAIFKVAK